MWIFAQVLYRGGVKRHGVVENSDFQYTFSPCFFRSFSGKANIRYAVKLSNILLPVTLNENSNNDVR